MAYRSTRAMLVATLAACSAMGCKQPFGHDPAPYIPPKLQKKNKRMHYKGHRR